jgi:uncharacterized membrane-anchored protein YjiN (DUF445 family)
MTDLTVVEHEHELIAQAMLMTRGDLAKASRLDSILHNAMELRKVVQEQPQIRARYHELLAQEMQEKGLHIAERILKMAELQEQAFGGIVEYEDELTGETKERIIPADPKTAIELSKEISRLIQEGKGTNMSAKSAVILASKEDAKEILNNFLGD